MTLDAASPHRDESSRQSVFTKFDFVAGDIGQRWVRVPGHQGTIRESAALASSPNPVPPQRNPTPPG